MALAVLVHAVREVAQAPVLALFDFAALIGDELGELVGERVDLGARYVLARDKDILIKRHTRPLTAGDGPERERRPGRAGHLTAAGKGARHYTERTAPRKRRPLFQRGRDLI
jgi:hypothetical protein